MREYNTSNWETLHFAGTKAVRLVLNYLDDSKRIYMELLLREKKLNNEA